MDFDKQHLQDLAELCDGEEWLNGRRSLMLSEPDGTATALYDNTRNFIAYATPARVLALLAENARLRAPATMVSLNYDLIGAHYAGETRHAQEVMRSLGIEYQKSTPQSLYDSWWFWNCTNVPSPLPKFLSVLKAKPHEVIGRGLSKEDADMLATPAAAAPQQAVPDLLPPMGIRNDRDMLNYLAQAFESEMSACNRCGHEESTSTCDSASFLRDYLAAAPVAAIEQPPTDAMLASWPQRICLQWNPGEREAYPGMSDDLTWCDHRIHRSDVEYVRADLADLRTQPPAA